MAAKCNITGIVLQKLDELQWGIKACADVDKSILEDYIGHLNCPEVTPTNCYPAPPCTNETIEVICHTNINKITASVDGNKVLFTVLPTDKIGFTEPMTYEWLYDTKVFSPSGPVNDYQLQLVVKEGIDITAIVAFVSVTITDAFGCMGNKVCYFSPVGMACNVNYVPCVNPSNLQIINTFTQCVSPSGLIITKL